MKLRLALLSTLAGVIVAASVAAFTTSAAASPAVAPAAAPTGGITSSIPCQIGGVASTCQLTVTSFNVVNGVFTAAGTVTGGGVTIPFSGIPVQASGSCQILDLTLGPLDLDLLGLVVHLDTVHLNITAQQGPGNLLGNLLCAVANLLNNQGGGNTTALQQIANLLNQILARL